MHTRRFGRKLKLPSTVAIKHEILKMMVQDELKAQALAVKAVEVLVAHGRGAAEALIAHIRHDGNNIEAASQFLGNLSGLLIALGVLVVASVYRAGFTQPETR